MNFAGELRKRIQRKMPMLDNRIGYGFLGLVPGGGVEPPRPEGRRILSPLRLPVPPSRRFVEMLDFTAYFTPYVFFIRSSECETVQVNVKVFMGFHRSLRHP